MKISKREYSCRKLWFLLILSMTVCRGLSQNDYDANLFTPCDDLTPCICVSNCDPTVSGVGDPYIYSGECSIGINRYLARAASVQGLIHLIYDQNFGQLECVPPYDNVDYTEYCPEKFCAMVNAMAKMDIQFLIRASDGAAYHEHELNTPGQWYNASAQLVKNINYAYDCASKPRPIIQNMIFEVVDGNNFEAAKMYHLYMPAWIIPQYFARYPADLTTESQNYYYENGQPKTTLYWERDRICALTTDDAGNPRYRYQIDKLEMRMWFLYQAMVFIDMGYTSLHMGLYEDYCNNDPGYIQLYKLTNLFREYAQSKNSFVLLSSEPTSNGSARYLFTNKFIFDFDTRAMRPREISTPQVSGDGSLGCDDPIDPSVLNDYYNSPCANELYPAVVDPCTIASYGSNTPGMHPLGCSVDYLPYLVHFDGFHEPVNPGVASNGPNSLTWGFHDHQWFSMLSSECQRWWFDYFYCSRREFSDGNGWIMIPGTIFYDASLVEPNNEPGYENATQLISDDSDFLVHLKDQTLAPAIPTIEIEEEDCRYYRTSPICDGHIAPFNQCYLVGKKCYTISVGNKDCSSVYSIHIQDAQGQWMPQEIGDSYHFCPPSSGRYTIYIRQDNLALIPENGVREVYGFYDLNPTCCYGPLYAACNYPIIENVPLESALEHIKSRSENLLSGSANDYTIYPNPVKDKLFIQTNQITSKETSISILNSVGTIVFTQTYGNAEFSDFVRIDTEAFAIGIYFIQIDTNSARKTYKFMKM